MVRRLGLIPHPEGGFYRETFRSPLLLSLPDGRTRSASTAIYYLLPPGAFSAWHQVASDEVWHHYAGAPLELRLPGKVIRLGTDLAAGEEPQAVVPPGVWQSARPLGGWVLVGCTVAPGFDFRDFEMPPRKELLERYPQHRALIERLTRMS